MKILLFSLTLIWTTLGYAQDCYYCFPFHLDDFLPYFSEWPIKYVDIEKPKYETNPKSSYCKRPPEMVDTIVLHHSETPSTDTPERINQFHLDRGWYMAGYSYMVSSPYPGSSSPRARVTEGRPLDLVGAHAGTDVFVPITQDQKKFWDDGKVTCGYEGQEFTVDPTMVKNGEIKANVTTIGLVVIGNYSPFSRSNPNGYDPRHPRYPTKQTIDLIARMSCQLQKKYPNMKNFKWHSYYHATSCPGNIKNYIGQIKAQAKVYGCEFY